jgi:Peptidase family M28
MFSNFKVHEAMRTLGLFVVLGAAGCGGNLPPVSPTAGAAGPFDGEHALARVAAQLDLGDRSPGTPGHTAIQTWIEGELRSAGWTPQRQSFPYHSQTLVNLTATSGSPSGPNILLGAHYDTRPLADESPLPNPGPVPGADDGASGVAVLLGLADVLQPQALSCQVTLAFFDGEDSGRLGGWDWIVGSTYLAQHLAGRPQAVIVVDMVGDRDLQLYFEQNSDQALRQEIWSAAQALGYSQFVPRVKYSMLDDHSAFLAQGIPAVDIIDFDYPYWHTPQDTLDKVSAASLEAVGRTLQSWIKSRCP